MPAKIANGFNETTALLWLWKDCSMGEYVKGDRCDDVAACLASIVDLRRNICTSEPGPSAERDR